MFNFLNEKRKEYIYNFFKQKILSNLKYDEFINVMDKLVFLIEYINIRFAIRPQFFDAFWDQLLQNNHRDLIAIFNLMLPYIDDKEGSFNLHKEINTLSDISDKLIDPNNDDLSKNNYLITNVKYNLLESYNLQTLNQSYALLLNTIDQISNKLFINWLNVVPISILNYSKSYLFEQSIKLIDVSRLYPTETIKLRIRHQNVGFENFDFNLKKSHFLHRNTSDYKNYFNLLYPSNNQFDSDFKINNNILTHTGVSFNDIFNTIYYDLFMDVIKYKWLIYQDTFDDPNHDEIYIKIFNDNLFVPELYLGTKWQELSSDKQISFETKLEILFDKVLSNKSKTRNSYFYLLKSIVIFFERNYEKINYIVKNYGYKKITTDDDNAIDDDDFDIVNEEEKGISEIDLIQRVKKIPSEELYTYFLNTIQCFSKTYYGREIIRKFEPFESKHYNYDKPGIIYDGLPNYKFTYEPNGYASIDKNYFTNELKNKDILTTTKIDLPENLKIKYKFIYNFAKAFVLTYDKDKPAYKPCWKNMNTFQKKKMIDFLNMSYNDGLNSQKSKNQNNHFNVMSFKKYYQRTYINSTANIDDTNIFFEPKDKSFSGTYILNLGRIVGNILFENIRVGLINMVFETHIIKGLLSEFIINPNLTDNNVLGSSYDEKKQNQFSNIKKYVFNEDNYDNYYYNSYYFLTDSTYSDLNEIHRNGKKSYFDLITSDYRWYSFYAMDWVSQINFFHKYINNRIIYITGATGQGKSTQVPKMFLYGLKMIDRNPNGKVICSQPRVAPTRDNSEQISFELGIPITENSINNKQKIKTYNSYVQYKTQDEYHTIENHNGLMLKVVTDRLLYMELLKSPIFKELEKPNTDSNTAEAVEFNIYKKENMYDIIMVDESHEHNLNMDLVLSIARDTVKYNNSLKLVIVSATMTEDEPVYRRYYKEINDNFSHPFSFFNSEMNYDRTTIDRRIHISPPGETTQHKVTDHYLDFEPNDYSEAEECGLKKILDIATNPILTKGDILFFSLSTEDIKRVCKTINQQLPPSSDIICLPFYRELPTKWNIFNELSKKVKQITVDRTDLFDEIYPDVTKITKKVPAGTYKRAIVVATNIAEASITIDSLKYVVDTGYFISVSDNPFTGETNIDKKKISEASRIQRRGRVGRVSSGTVYYMYMRDSRKEFKSEPKICIENISNELCDIMCNKYDDKELIPVFEWEILYCIQIPKKPGDELFKDFFNGPSGNYLFNSKMLVNLLKEQYCYMGYFMLSIANFFTTYNSTNTINKLETALSNINNILKYDFYDEDKYCFITNFDLNKIYRLVPSRTSRYISGYNIKDCIYDTNGSFYIVHPEEKNIKRDIYSGKIISTKYHEFNNYSINEYIISQRIHNYLKLCLHYNLLIDHSNIIIPKKIFSKNDIIKFSQYSLQYEKSNIGRISAKLTENLKLNESATLNRALIQTLIYSYIVNLDHIVLIMIALLHHSNYQLSGLNSNPSAFNTLFCSQNTDSNDLYIYYKLALDIYTKINTIIKNNHQVQLINFSREKTQYINQKLQIMSNIKNKSNYWHLDIPIEQYMKFNTLDNQNKLDINKNISEYINENSKRPTKDTIKYFIEIIAESSINIDSNSANKLIKYYMESKNALDKLKNTNNSDTDINTMLWFKHNLPIEINNDEWISIKNSFIYGFSLNNTSYFDSENNEYIDTLHITKKFKPSITYTQPSEYIVYLNRNTLKNEISILINADIDTLVKCNLYTNSPLFIRVLNNLNSIPNDKLITKLYNQLNSIANNRNNYISHLKIDIPPHPNLNEKLFKYKNNFIENLMSIWTSNLPNQPYYNFTQLGGKSISSNFKKIKIRINKIPYLLKKLNIDDFEFYALLNKLSKNGHNIYYHNNYLYII
jgi:hypothetical protein